MDKFTVTQVNQYLEQVNNQLAQVNYIGKQVTIEWTQLNDIRKQVTGLLLRNLGYGFYIYTFVPKEYRSCSLPVAITEIGGRTYATNRVEKDTPSDRGAIMLCYIQREGGYGVSFLLISTK